MLVNKLSKVVKNTQRIQNIKLKQTMLIIFGKYILLYILLIKLIHNSTYRCGAVICNYNYNGRFDEDRDEDPTFFVGVRELSTFAPISDIGVVLVFVLADSKSSIVILSGDTTNRFTDTSKGYVSSLSMSIKLTSSFLSRQSDLISVVWECVT